MIIATSEVDWIFAVTALTPLVLTFGKISAEANYIEFHFHAVIDRLMYICYSEYVKSGNVYIAWNFQGIYTFPDSLRDCIYSLKIPGNIHIH